MDEPKESLKAKLKRPHDKWKNKYHVVKEFQVKSKTYTRGVHWADKIWPQKDTAETHGIESERRINTAEYRIKYLGAYPVDN